MLHFQLCSAHYTALQMKNSRRSASAINPVITKNTAIHVPQLSITVSKVQWPVHFTISYGQPVLQHYKQRTVLELPQNLQSIQLPRKIQMISIYKRIARKPCIVLPRINILSCQQKEMGHKGGQR